MALIMAFLFSGLGMLILAHAYKSNELKFARALRQRNQQRR